MDVGANIIEGKHIIECTKQMMQAGNSWKNPRGNGDVDKTMVDELIANV